MIKLTIREKGYNINIPGVGQVRTPCKINITKKDVNLILTELRKLGIENFSITYNVEVDKKDRQETSIKKIVKEFKENKSTDLTEIQLSLNKIEKLLSKIANKNVEVIGDSITYKEKIKLHDEDEDMFIPMIEPTENRNIKLKVKVEKSDNDALDASKQLSDLLKGDNK